MITSEGTAAINFTSSKRAIAGERGVSEMMMGGSLSFSFMA